MKQRTAIQNRRGLTSRKRTSFKVNIVSSTAPRFASADEAVKAAVPALAALIQSNNATKQPVGGASPPQAASNSLQQRRYTLAELRALMPEQRAALMPTAADALGALLAGVVERMATPEQEAAKNNERRATRAKKAE